MDERFSRTAMLLGNDAVGRLARAKVAIFGIGGVGGYAAEALARGGVGSLDLVDRDKVSLSNINRQIIATSQTLGKPKALAMKERILTINPQARVEAHCCFFLPETADQFDFREYDYIVDAVDTVAAKIHLALKAREAGIPIISCMGAGNKLDPTQFEVADLARTSVCPLARVMRRELKKRGIEHLKVVYSREAPIKPCDGAAEGTAHPVPGSVSFVPSVAGLILAGEVMKDLAGDTRREDLPV